MSSFFSKFFRKQKQKKSEPSLPRLKQNPGASASGPSLSNTMSRESSDRQVPSDDIVGVDNINTSELNSKKIENEFKLGQKYTRLEVARLLFPDRETFDEELLTRSIQISNYLIVFLELGIPGETGNEFPHRFDEKNNVITWFSEPNQFLSGSLIDKVLDNSIQQIFFIRYVASGPYCFWGEGKVVYFKKNVRTINGLSLKIGTVLDHRVDQKNSYSQQNMILQNLDGNAAFNALEIGSYYSRSEVAKIARPNNPPNGGDWITSYAEMDGNLYVFLNIGVPGKTGHDFDNRFDRASRELTWFSKPNKKSTSPLFQRILKGHLSLLFFIRTDTKNKFEFLGGGQVTKHMDNVRTKHGLALRLTVQLINSAPLERELDEQEMPTEEVVDVQGLNYETELEDKYISQLINAYSTDDRLLSIANDSYLSTATFADFLADREMFEKEIKLVPKLGKKLSLELMQLLEQLRLSRLPEDQHEYTEDKNTEKETTSTVSVRKFVESIDCSYALYEQTRAPYFQQVYVEGVLENLDVFNSELTDRALLSQTVQHELLERLRAEKRKNDSSFKQGNDELGDGNNDALNDQSVNPLNQSISSMLAEAFCSHRLRSRANTDIFQKLTVLDALSRPDYFWKCVKSIPNLGTKSFDELERLLKKHELSNDTAICEPYSLKLTQGQIRELMEVCCANDQRSKRVQSALLEELSTINDYEGLIRSIRSSPKRLEKVGSKTADVVSERLVEIMKKLASTGKLEIEGLFSYLMDPEAEWLNKYDIDRLNDHFSSFTSIKQVLFEITASDLFGTNYQETIFENPEFSFVKIASDFSSSDNLDLIAERFGLFGSNTHTLEELALPRNVTRERIRQIEASILDELRHPLLIEFFEFFFVNSMERMFASAGLTKEFITSEAEVLLEHGFTNFDKLGVEVLGLDRSLFFSKFYENSTPHIHNRTSVSSTVLEDNFLSLKAFKNTVSALIINGKWPILLEDLQALYPQFTPEKICQITNTELNLTIDGGSFKGTPKLSNEQLITAIFNIKGRAMSPEEMTDHIKAIFGKHVPVRSIRNILARMDEALIVERGVYNSYSNLGIQTDDIGQLRDTCFTYLRGVSQFMSAAKLLENAPKIVQGITTSSYTLMGILQDDPRFITKRGLMIGLVEFDDAKFENLSDQIENFVRELGPVSIQDLQLELSTYRRISKQQIIQGVSNNQAIVEVQKNVLDLVERVIGDTFEQNNLLLAAALLLKQNDTSFVKLNGHLSEVGIDISTTVLESFLRTRLDMRIRSGIVSMKKFPIIIGIGESNIDQIFWTPDFQNEIENNKNLDSVMLKKLATKKGEDEYSSNSSSIVNQILDDFL